MPIITDINQLDLDGSYTVADYMSWRFDELVQLIRGRIVRMSPAAKDKHFLISARLERTLFPLFPEEGPCQFRHAAYDVYLDTPGAPEQTVVQPDLFIVCDPRKIHERGCVGAPDWVCEIVSKGSVKLDTVTKLRLYEEAGIPEYWIIFPEQATVLVYNLQGVGYGEPTVYDQPGQEISSRSITSFSIIYETLFPQ